MKQRPAFKAASVTIAALAAVLSCGGAQAADDADEGQALLQRHCGRCHAIADGATSKLAKAPNLWTVLRSYPIERLDFELAEGIGSTHPTMPQIQFKDEDITAIFYYLHPEANPQ